MTAGIVTLTEQQVRALVEDKLDGTGPCRVHDLPTAEIVTNSIVPNARILMAQLDGIGAKLTAKGNLNRKLVETLVDRFDWLGVDAAEVRRFNKVVNEEDYIPAMYLHAVLKLAGLARTEKGFLKLTKKGRSLLAEDAAGQLQSVLFRTTFARYNPAYLDRYDLPEFFAPQIGLILFLISQCCDDWRPADALMRSVSLPIDEAQNARYPDMVVSAFEVRVLRYLRWFGLMEQQRPAANHEWRQPRLYRKTKLFDRVLTFQL